MSALPALQNAGYYNGNLHPNDPISVIRVRVAGVTGPNAVSLARIREVAQQIEQRTHLVVDIVVGSSPRPTAIDLPAGKFGQPALTLTENWVKKGVAFTILTAVDKNSVVLFALILIVCVLFVANSATAAVRGRRRELGVLACLGWTRPRLFASVLGELAAIGLTAGILGAAAALPLVIGARPARLTGAGGAGRADRCGRGDDRRRHPGLAGSTRGAGSVDPAASAGSAARAPARRHHRARGGERAAHARPARSSLRSAWPSASPR